MMILVSPALRVCEGFEHRCTELTFGILCPLVFGSFLITIAEFAGFVNLADMTLFTLTTRVEELLGFCIIEHARSLSCDYSLNSISLLFEHALALFG